MASKEELYLLGKDTQVTTFSHLRGTSVGVLAK